MPNYDLLVYHDFTDTINPMLSVGDNAEEKLGSIFKGLYVVAVGPPAHDSKDATVVLAHGKRPMPELLTRDE